MLLDELQGYADLATQTLEEFGTAFCNIVRSTPTPDGYGGETTVDSTFLSDVPCDYEAASDRAKATYQLGVESSLGFITMPRFFEGSEIDLRMTDRILIQANDLITHDRTFQVKDIDPNRGVFYHIAVTEENKTNG